MITGHHTQEIATSVCPSSICWFKKTQLVIFASDHLEIHQVTPEQSKLLHKQTCDDWTQKFYPKLDSLHHVVSMAVSDATPNKIFLTCAWRPGFLYQVEVFQVIKKILISKCKIKTGDPGAGDQDKKVCRPYCLAANTSSVVILLDRLIASSLLVCNLPNLQQQRIVKVGFMRYNQLAMSNDLLLLLHGNKVIVKSLSDLKTTLCQVHPPKEGHIRSITLSKDGLELFLACSTIKDSLSVYKYRCIGHELTQTYTRTSWCISTDIGLTCQNGLSVAANFIGVIDSENSCVRVSSLNSSIWGAIL